MPDFTDFFTSPGTRFRFFDDKDVLPKRGFYYAYSKRKLAPIDHTHPYYTHVDRNVADVWDFGRPGRERTVLELEHEFNLSTGYTSVNDHLAQADARRWHELALGRAVITRELLDLLVPHMAGRVVEPFAGRGLAGEIGAMAL